MPKQMVLEKILPKPTELQRMALVLAEAEQEADDAQARADKKKDELVARMQMQNCTSVKVLDNIGYTHTYDIELGKLKLKHRAAVEVHTERIQEGE